MSISKQFSSVSKRLVLIIVGLSVLSVAMLSFALYETNSLSFGGNVTSEELSSYVEGNDAVSEYLESEKDYEAHFVALANLIKEDQQQSLGRAVLLVTIPVIAVAAGLGYMVARYVLKPVRESYESQERFLQDAAHELRNPLAAMSLALENTKGKKTIDKDFVKTVQRQTNRLVRINEDLLYLERRTPGEKLYDIDISSLLEDVIEDLQPSISHKKIIKDVKIQPGIKLKMDQKDFIKMSKNIIENAIKYSKSGKKLTVRLSQDNHIDFVVQDQGIGIAQDDLSHIGERFYRAKNAASVDGTGLGLAIVNKVLNVYGGRIDIDSQVGRGTTVKITF